MANIESTDVSELIEPESLLTDDEPEHHEAAPQAPTNASYAPQMRGGSDMLPLPRRRAPHSTQTNIHTNGAPAVACVDAPPARDSSVLPPLPSPVPAPSRLTTIPPPQPSLRARATLPPPRAATQPPVANTRGGLTPLPAPLPSRPSQSQVGPLPTPSHLSPSPIAPLPVAPTPVYLAPTMSSPMFAPPITMPADALPAAWQTRTVAPEFLGEADVTHRVRRDAASLGGSLGGLAKHKLALPLTAIAIAGVAFGAYFALRGGAQAAPITSSPAVAPIAQPVAAATPIVAAPAPAPIVAPAPTVTAIAAAPAPTITAIAPAAPALVDVHFESQPAGAKVMLVDHGETAFLGTTPVNRALDPSRTYYAVFTSVDHAPKVATIDPHASQRVVIDLGLAQKAPAAIASAPAPAAAPAAIAPTPAPASHPAKVASASSSASSSSPATAATGMLMISSKPPCMLTIDGKATNLRTPQKAVKLSAGTHHIEFINAQLNIHRSFRMEVPAGKTAKMIMDLTKK